MSKIKYVTEGGKPNTHNVYYDDWTYRLNSDIDVSDQKITTFTIVNEEHKKTFPEQYIEKEEE